MRRQESEKLALGLRLLPVAVGLLLRGRRGVIDVAREERRLPFLVHEPHRVVLMAAFAAEVYGVQPFFLLAGKELLAIHRHRAGAGRLDRHESVASARDELVQLERVEAALTRGSVFGA